MSSPTIRVTTPTGEERPRIIFVLIGAQGCGKDTAAHGVKSKVKRVAFADALKEHVADTYQLPLSLFHNVAAKDTPFLRIPPAAYLPFGAFIAEGQDMWTPRDLLLLEGAVKRAVNPNFWVDRLIDIIEESAQDVIVTDCRFPDELQALMSIATCRTVTIAIKRRLLDTDQSAAMQFTEALAKEMTHATYTIHNSRSVEALQRRMQDIVSQETAS